MEHHFKTHHWSFTKFKHRQSNNLFAIFNVYMPNNPAKKVKCWNTMLSLRNLDYSKNCIIAGDLNIIRNNVEKRRGIFGRDPFCDNLQELIMEWDLLDIPPQWGKFTLTNICVDPGHIAARMDCFLVHNSFLHHNAAIKSYILPSLISDHKPISLHLSALPNYWPSSLSI